MKDCTKNMNRSSICPFCSRNCKDKLGIFTSLYTLEKISLPVESAACLAAVMKPARAHPNSAVVTSSGSKSAFPRGHN